MAVLGVNAVGPSGDNNGSGVLIVSGGYQTGPRGGLITSMAFWLQAVTTGGGAGSQACRLCVINDIGGAPGTTVLGITDEQIFTDTEPAGWKVMNSWTNSPGGQPFFFAGYTKYWLGHWVGTQVNSAVINVRWNATPSPDNQRFQTAAYSSTGLPTLGAWTNAGATNAYSWFAEYDNPASQGLPRRMPIAA